MARRKKSEIEEALKELKAKIKQLEGEVETVKTRYNTLKSELDHIAKIINNIIEIQIKQKPLLERIEQLIEVQTQILEELRKLASKKKRWGLF